MPLFTGRFLSKNARATDQPVLVIFAVTLIVVTVAIISLFQLINREGSAHPVELTFALLSIPLGWFTIHAMTALHYAHVYWVNDEDTDPAAKRNRKSRSAASYLPVRNGRTAGIFSISRPPSA
ncbi:DUF1345 domain-containing protein [Mesorhizobium sp.]|uniref:DUF1345 domain-containing protein n=1 Tax=Mesorhizobium sp. TaxID=1871066 RepID=UPI0025808AAD|nr:DUF1345 domain-containing protein [Mesorhizobium sp.]